MWEISKKGTRVRTARQHARLCLCCDNVMWLIHLLRQTGPPITGPRYSVPLDVLNNLQLVALHTVEHGSCPGLVLLEPAGWREVHVVSLTLKKVLSFDQYCRHRYSIFLIFLLFQRQVMSCTYVLCFIGLMDYTCCCAGCIVGTRLPGAHNIKLSVCYIHI